MKASHRKLLAATIVSFGVGVLLIIPVLTSQSGYVAGYAFFPMLLLVAFFCLCLFIIGFVFLFREDTAGLYFLIAMLMLPAGFFGSAVTAKYLELGAYREDPMKPIVDPVANKVLFKRDATHEEIERFWSHVIGYPTGPTSSWSRPGVGGGARFESENGHEVIVFSFRPEASEEEKEDIRERIRKYPPVYQFLENVDATPVDPLGLKIDNSNGTKSVNRAPREPNTFKIEQ